MLWPKLVCFALVSLVFGQLYYAAGEESFSACPTNFTRVADKCLLFDDSWKNWYESDRHCRSINAGLLSIKNQTEMKAINEWLKVAASYQVEIWTSGNKLGEAKTYIDYYWQSSGEKATYLNWNAGQPTPASGDCLILLANLNLNSTSGEYVLDDHRLTVRNCTQWAPHICETQPTQFRTQLCLTPEAFQEVHIPV